MNNLPEEPEEETPPEEYKAKYKISTIISSFLIDGFFQVILTKWFAWISMTMFKLNFNHFLFWLGMTVAYCTLHYYYPKDSGVWIVRHVSLLILLTIIIMFFF